MNYKFKTVIIVATALSVFGMVPVTQAATLTELYNKQNQLKIQEENSKKMIAQKKAEAANLQEAISDIQSDVSSTQNRIKNTEEQIAVTTEVIASLNQDITNTSQKLDILNTKLKSAYSSLYEMSQVSMAEMILQSDSLDDIVVHSQYIQSIQDDLNSNINEANAIMSDLSTKKSQSENQKKDLESLKSNLNQDKSSLISQRNQKDYLLDVTQGDQAKYEALLAQIKKDTSNISAEIYKKRTEMGGFLNTGGTGGYPYANSTPDIPDPWRFLTRECTSYAAWKFASVYGIPFMNTRPGSGSAYNWPNLARDQGYHTTNTPRVSSIIQWGPYGSVISSYGHVAWVEAVYSSTDIIISEYNWNRFSYSERRINPNSYGTATYIYP